MTSYVLIDSVIFILSNIILGIYVFKNKKLELKEKIAYTIFFIILNSSFNIMLKPIHDYNKVIPRTFIYRQKLIWKFSILDIICILYILVNIKFLFKNIRENKFILSHIIRAAGIYIIGTISFLIFKGYWIDNGNRFLIVSKGWVYSLATIIFSFKYLKKNINLIYPFAIILLNGMFSTFFVPINDIWVRYGNRAIIIDQEDAYTVSNLLITFLIIKCLYIKDKNTKDKILDWIMLIFFIFQNIYCVYKTNLIVLPLIFILYLIITKGKNKILALSTMLGIPTMILIFWNKLYALITSKAINTRFIQISDYLKYIQEKGIYPYIFGSGIATPYYSNTDSGDSGERKLIDLQNNINTEQWRTDIQTPILSNFKETGIVGILYFIITTIYILYITISMIVKVLKNKNIDNYIKTETFGIGLFLFINSIIGVYLYGGTIAYPIFYGFLISKFTMNYKKIMSRGEKNENIDS